MQLEHGLFLTLNNLLQAFQLFIFDSNREDVLKIVSDCAQQAQQVLFIEISSYVIKFCIVVLADQPSLHQSLDELAHPLLFVEINESFITSLAHCLVLLQGFITVNVEGFLFLFESYSTYFPPFQDGYSRLIIQIQVGYFGQELNEQIIKLIEVFREYGIAIVYFMVGYAIIQLNEVFLANLQQIIHIFQNALGILVVLCNDWLVHVHSQPSENSQKEVQKCLEFSHSEPLKVRIIISNDVRYLAKGIPCNKFNDILDDLIKLIIRIQLAVMFKQFFYKLLLVFLNYLPCIRTQIFVPPVLSDHNLELGDSRQAYVIIRLIGYGNSYEVLYILTGVLQIIDELCGHVDVILIMRVDQRVDGVVDQLK